MTFQSAALADSPLGLWVLSEYDAGTVPDLSGNGRHASGNLVDVRTTGGPGPGLPGHAHVHLIENALSISDPMHLPAGGAPFTIETWVHASGWTSSARLCGNNVSTYGWWARTSNTSGNLRLSLSGVADINSTAVVPVNAWAHVVIRSDRATGRLRFFVNGVEGGDAALSTSYNQTTGQQFSPLPATSQDRKCAAVALYGTELSPTRIQAHYDAAIGVAAGPWVLTTTVNGSGTITKSPNAADYADGASVELTAVPTAGWSFSGWSGALSGSTNPATLVMDGDKAVTATFTEDSGPPPEPGARRKMLVIQQRVAGVWTP